MYHLLASAAAAGLLLATAGVALAQTYPAPAYPPPAYNSTYPTPYATTPTPPPPSAYGPTWDGTHTGGGASRAYSYWGAQKSN